MISELAEAPNEAQFIPLAEHQSETPTTFFGTKPVLHYHSPNATIVVEKSNFVEYEFLQNLHAAIYEDSVTSNGDSVAEMITMEGVDVWITSKDFIIFSRSTNKGISIPYPAIGIHALGSYESKAAIILQLNLHDADAVNSDDDFETLDLNLIPTESCAATEGTNRTNEAPNPAKLIFEALSACADLHPDPESPDGEEGQEDTTPGAGGWITSENMGDMMDADGNFIGFGTLGAGAGTVRTRDEDMEDAEEETIDTDDTKWRRIE